MKKPEILIEDSRIMEIDNNFINRWKSRKKEGICPSFTLLTIKGYDNDRSYWLIRSVAFGTWNPGFYEVSGSESLCLYVSIATLLRMVLLSVEQIQKFPIIFIKRTNRNLRISQSNLLTSSISKTAQTIEPIFLHKESQKVTRHRSFSSQQKQQKKTFLFANQFHFYFSSRFCSSNRKNLRSFLSRLHQRGNCSDFFSYSWKQKQTSPKPVASDRERSFFKWKLISEETSWKIIIF